MTEVKIKVPSHYPQFTVNEELHIEIMVSIQKPCKIKQVYVQFIGSEELNSSNPTKHIFLCESRTIIPLDSFSNIKKRESLFGLFVKKENDYSKWVGIHSFRFKAHIPNICPSSLQIDNALIQYVASTFVTFEDEKRRDFVVSSNVIIPVTGRLIEESDIKRYSNPFYHSEERSFLFSSKQLGIFFNLNKLLYSTGEEIVTDIKLRNETSKKITRITLLLLQKVIIDRITDEYVIMQKEFGPMNNNEFSEVLRYSIPVSLSESIKKINLINGSIGNIIQISYRVKLRLEVKVAKTIRISIPILIMKPKRLTLEDLPVLSPTVIDLFDKPKHFDEDYTKIIDISIQRDIENFFK